VRGYELIREIGHFQSAFAEFSTIQKEASELKAQSQPDEGIINLTFESFDKQILSVSSRRAFGFASTYESQDK
jgi:hypothetical protein